MKKAYLLAIPVFGIIAMTPITYGLWTLTKTSGEASVDQVSYSVAYHYTDYNNGGSSQTRTISGLEIDGYFLMDDLRASGYIFDGWKRSSSALTAHYPALEHVSIRSLLSDLSADGISPTQTTSGNHTTYTIHLYDAWTVYSEDEGVIITVTNVGGSTLYTYATRNREYVPVFVLSHLDSNKSTLEYYQYASNIRHYAEYGAVVTTNTFYPNHTIIMDEFPSGGITLVAHYSA